MQRATNDQVREHVSKPSWPQIDIADLILRHRPVVYSRIDHGRVQPLVAQSSTAFSPEGAILASGTEDGRIWLYQAQQ